MASVIVKLDDEALLALQEVLIDGDAEAALDFVRKHVATQVPEKGNAPCDSSRLNPYLGKSPTGKRRKGTDPQGR
ncbi:MAG: hypothetical protein ACYTGB_10235 [Planctomycetota bacterium]|jgi:hypothetical protein